MNLPLTHSASSSAVASNLSPMLPRVHRGRGRSLRDYASPTAFGLDFLAICVGAGAALELYKALGGIHVENELFNFLAFSIQYALAFILFGRVYSLYSYKHSLLKVRDTAGILRVSTFCFLLLAFESLFSQIAIPRLLLILSWFLITIFVLLEKHTFRKMFARWKAKEVIQRRALILGSGAEARQLFSFLSNSPELKLLPAAFFEERNPEANRVVYSHDYKFTSHATVHGGRLDADVLQRLDIAEIFMADPTLSPTRLSEITQLASDHKVAVSFVGPAQVPGIGMPVNFRVMDGLLVTSYSGSYDTGFGYILVKRMLDIVFCGLMFLASLPVWIIAAVWIKWGSEGPVFFKQDRIGINGESFKMFKFRSMYTTAPKYGRSPESSDDPRITPAGRFLRRTSLDELPQLINVFLGHMSLVGPRPEMPYIVSAYTPHEKQRLQVPQGLTGMWQLSADRKYAIHESIEYDLYYIQNRGVFLDLAILLHTAAFAMKGI